MTRFVCIHGHFYQPPRENPWTGTIEQDPSALPFHDWDERITTECYQPNTSAPLIDDYGKISGFVNNYMRMSFDFGPTLLRWLERNSPDTYAAILRADRDGRNLFEGHGGAMAQIYNHMIMPLANSGEKRTQTIWGVEDFKRRFGRVPEGMWLPETAVDTSTLESLAEAGIKYTVLSPHQALAIRSKDRGKWLDVSGGRINTRRAYTCDLPSGRSISLFFYDKGISNDLAFGSLLESGDRLAERLTTSFVNSEESQLISLASDGETYGHHHRQGHISLARCLSRIDKSGDVRITNFGHFLSLSPPSYVVRIAESTSWSCSHGVERWRSNCGCGGEIRAGYDQNWRAPLRESLDWLHNTINNVYLREGTSVFVDPLGAKDHLGSISMERRSDLNRYLENQTKSGLSPDQKAKAVSLAEMVICASLMLASCAWFWEDISRPEPVQALRFASRGMELATLVGGLSFEDEFKSIIGRARPNDRRYRTGEELYVSLARKDDSR